MAETPSASYPAVNLPQTDFPMKAGLAQLEPKMLARWTETRELRPLPKETFREWWSRERGA